MPSPLKSFCTKKSTAAAGSRRCWSLLVLPSSQDKFIFFTPIIAPGLFLVRSPLQPLTPPGVEDLDSWLSDEPGRAAGTPSRVDFSRPSQAWLSLGQPPDSTASSRTPFCNEPANSEFASYPERPAGTFCASSSRGRLPVSAAGSPLASRS